ncbi:hypothetical protein N6H14_19345 [Paenibacillus sp. CC-CFT747]|nr:hypothetical protein N6H14_19345 [Paenibacillus sp. CC-CFT747]
MTRKHNGRWLIIVVLAVLVGWPVYQLADWYKNVTSRHDASYSLFEVSLFQMELLNSTLREAATAQDTGQLDTLKLAAYSAQFTHERLAAAMEEEGLADLASLPQLQQVLLRLQIGGRRTLKPEETQLIGEAAELFQRLYEEYGGLMGPNHRLIPSKNDKVRKFDKELQELLRKKPLGG